MPNSNESEKRDIKWNETAPGCQVEYAIQARGFTIGDFSSQFENLPQEQFVRTWSALFYLFPGLHPDGFEAADSGWPRVLRRFAAEAWRRVEAGGITEEELYPCDAQWCGLYDRMFPHTAAEMERRFALAADGGEASGI